MRGFDGLPSLAAAGLVLAVAGFLWLRMLISESSQQGNGARALDVALQMGVILFILSELMVFLGIFWGWFLQSWACAEAHGPLPGVDLLDGDWCYHMDLGFALLNTALLTCSGVATAVAQSALVRGWLDGVVASLLLAVTLAAAFTVIQSMEYAGNVFDITTGLYGTAFYTLTGLHGLHVQIGTALLIGALVRVWRGGCPQAAPTYFLSALFYWHFVDVVWIFLYLTVYMAPNSVLTDQQGAQGPREGPVGRVGFMGCADEAELSDESAESLCGGAVLVVNRYGWQAMSALGRTVP